MSELHHFTEGDITHTLWQRDFLEEYANFLTVSDAIMIPAAMTKGAAESIYYRRLIVNREHSAILGIASPRGESQLVSMFESVGKTVSVLNGKRRY